MQEARRVRQRLFNKTRDVAVGLSPGPFVLLRSEQPAADCGCLMAATGFRCVLGCQAEGGAPSCSGRSGETFGRCLITFRPTTACTRRRAQGELSRAGGFNLAPAAGEAARWTDNEITPTLW